MARLVCNTRLLVLNCVHAGSGKSYTMMGASGDAEQAGIIPRLCRAIFDRIHEQESDETFYKVT